jgi:hypothetical protein
VSALLRPVADFLSRFAEAVAANPKPETGNRSQVAGMTLKMMEVAVPGSQIPDSGFTTSPIGHLSFPNRIDFIAARLRYAHAVRLSSTLNSEL